MIMKAYVSYRKVKNKLEYGITVYDEGSKVLFSNTKIVDDLKEDGKFLNALNSLKWGIKQINLQTERGVLSSTENLLVLISNKTLYTWFENNASIKIYAVEFSDLMFEINLLMNDVEVIYAENSNKKVIYKKRGATDDNLTKVSDMFTGIED